MTGLDVHRDALIEVSVVVTDANLTLAGPGFDVLIKPEQAALDHMNDFVRQMHTKSGLLDELEKGETLVEAEKQVLEFIQQYVPQPKKALLAGNSVGTDKRFLEEYMPRVIDHLHYRLIDVSSVKELAKRWYPHAYEETPVKHGGHRALADILESIQELEYYRRVLFPAGTGPTREEAQRISAEVVALGIPSHD